MSHAPCDFSQFDGCRGSCNQGRRACDCRWDGTTRDTQPGDLLPNTGDPAQEATGVWYVAGMMLACFFLALGLSHWGRA